MKIVLKSLAIKYDANIYSNFNFFSSLYCFLCIFYKVSLIILLYLSTKRRSTNLIRLLNFYTRTPLFYLSLHYLLRVLVIYIYPVFITYFYCPASFSSIQNLHNQFHGKWLILIVLLKILRVIYNIEV